MLPSLFVAAAWTVLNSRPLLALAIHTPKGALRGRDLPDLSNSYYIFVPDNAQVISATANIVTPNSPPSGDINKSQVLHLLLGEIKSGDQWDMAIACEIGNVYGDGSQWRYRSECIGNNCNTIPVIGDALSAGANRTCDLELQDKSWMVDDRAAAVAASKNLPAITYVSLGVDLGAGATWDFGDIKFTGITIVIQWKGSPGTDGSWCNSRNSKNTISADLDDGQYDLNEDELGTCSIGALTLSPS